MSRAPTCPQIDLAHGALVIADLHLDANRPTPESARFEAFASAQRGSPALVILGDLFDAWVGPAHLELEGARRVAAALRALSASGTRVDVLVGNRDFLLDAAFERATGARVHPGALLGVAGELRVLFVHGDELCTLDHGYQRLKAVLRSGPVIWLAPRLPRWVALAAARRLRRASVKAVAEKPAAEKEQQAAAAQALAARARASTLICGHAHAYRDERRAGLRWIVVDAFGGPRDVLRLQADGAIASGSSARS